MTCGGNEWECNSEKIPIIKNIVFLSRYFGITNMVFSILIGVFLLKKCDCSFKVFYVKTSHSVKIILGVGKTIHNGLVIFFMNVVANCGFVSVNGIISSLIVLVLMLLYYFSTERYENIGYNPRYLKKNHKGYIMIAFSSKKNILSSFTQEEQVYLYTILLVGLMKIMIIKKLELNFYLASLFLYMGNCM